MLNDLTPLLDTFLYRPARPRFDRQFRSGDWDERIDHLLAAGYGFCERGFTPGRTLFRGMASGLYEAIGRGSFGHFEAADETSRAERVMEILFVTHELSDAITAAQLHQAGEEAALIWFDSDYFIEQQQQRRAAVMEIGDMGVIFQYPLLAEPIPLSAVAGILGHPQAVASLGSRHPALTSRLHVIEPGERAEVITDAERILSAQQRSPASLVAGGRCPRWRDYQ